MSMRFVMLALPLALLACMPEMPVGGNPMPPELPPANACHADELQDLVGQSAKRLEVMRFAGPVRIIRPGMAVTMDYSPSRLNIMVNEQEIIWRVNCG